MTSTTGATPPPFSAVLTSRILPGIVKTLVIGAGLRLLGEAEPLEVLNTLTAFVTALFVVIALEVVLAAVQRLFPVGQRRSAPGTLLLTAIVMLLPVPIGLLLGLLFTSSLLAALATMLVTAVVYGNAAVVLERPWAAADPHAEAREKVQELRAAARGRHRSRTGQR